MNDKYISFLENMDEKTRYFLLAGVLLVVLLLDYFIIMRPQLKMLSKVSPKIKVLSDDIKKAETDISNLMAYRGQVKDLQQKLALINGKIRSKDELSTILSNISRIAHESGVKIDQILPNPQDLELLLEKDNKKYYYLPIHIEARTGYHNFGRFLNRIENEEVSLRVGKFTLSSRGDEKNHLMNLTLDAIVYEEG